MKSLSRYADFSYTCLRVVSGLLFAFHGAQKVFGVFGGFKPPLLSQVGVGGLIELVAGLLIMIGLKTRSAAFLSSGTMAVAYAQFHWKGQMGANFWPAVNKGELAAIYAFVFLYMACRGSGSFAVRPD